VRLQGCGRGGVAGGTRGAVAEGAEVGRGGGGAAKSGPTGPGQEGREISSSEQGASLASPIVCIGFSLGWGQNLRGSGEAGGQGIAAGASNGPTPCTKQPG